MEKQLPAENKKLEKLIDTHANGSQNAFAEMIGVPQSNINRLFRLDERNNEYPNVIKSKSVLVAITNKFPFADIEWFKKEEKQTTTTNTNDIEVSHLDAATSSIMQVPLISNYAYAGYLNGYGDSEYIESLPKIPFILDKEYRGEYLCFEVKGDSMENDSEESIPEGSILLCRNVRQVYWKSKLHINKWDFVIVHRTDGILVKRIIKHDVEQGQITIHSLNEFYNDRVLNLEDVKQIFNIVEIQIKRKRR
ncbi:S24 family peptidase [Flavobacterium sp.]